MENLYVSTPQSQGFTFNVLCCSRFGSFQSFFKVKELNEEQLAKVKKLSQGDMTNAERRVWYNALNRRIGRGGLKPGLAEKFQSASGAQKFEMLKAFMADEDMFLGFIIGHFSRSGVSNKHLDRASS